MAADPADSPLYLPYKALLSTVRSMVFTEGEAQQLIEIMSDKTGIIQDTWHKVWPAYKKPLDFRMSSFIFLNEWSFTFYHFI